MNGVNIMFEQIIESVINYWNSIQGNLTIGLQIMGAGISIVFLVLAILYFVIKIMGKFAK